MNAVIKKAGGSLRAFVSSRLPPPSDEMALDFNTGFALQATATGNKAQRLQQTFM